MGSGDRDDDALAPTETPQAGLDETLASESRPRDAPGTIGPGAVVGRLVLGPLLGAGGMGVVHRAHDPELDRAVAVKLVRSRLGGSSGKVRLVREAQAMAKLRHPNVVSIFDVGTVGDDVFVVMPLLEGGTLGAWARAEARPWREVVDRYLAAGRGLAAAHAAELVHRDFKPDNVLLGAGGEVQVADFGLARVDRDEVAPAAMARLSPPLSLDLTRTGDVLGTPAYMAPEQMRGEEVDARADQFSFCVALWEGDPPARPARRPRRALAVDAGAARRDRGAPPPGARPAASRRRARRGGDPRRRRDRRARPRRLAAARVSSGTRHRRRRAIATSGSPGAATSSPVRCRPTARGSLWSRRIG
jgi:eukaryotic-like serine/threonine-protein kinase